jgi:hypothetical protein
MHWQFSLDKKENLYFGGKSSSDESSEIYFSKYENGEYQNPARVTPDSRYLFFTFFNGKGHMVYWVDVKIIE